VRLIRSSFCYFTSRRDGNIRFNAELAGGAMMDVGCYCVSFSRLFAGQSPSSIGAAANRIDGIDDLAAATLAYPNGIIATLSCGMTVHANNTAYVCGSAGYIEIPVPWKPPRQRAEFTIARSTPPRMDHAHSQAGTPPPRETCFVDAGMDLYALEADAFAAAVLDGKEPFVTADETLANMRVLDEIRRQIGVRW
jgi:predicted dehydrogenase